MLMDAKKFPIVLPLQFKLSWIPANLPCS